MVVPNLAIDVQLHETDATLYQPACDQTASAVGVRRLPANAVGLLNGDALLAQIKGLGRGQLHAGSQFVAGNAGIEVGLPWARLLVDLIEPAEQVALHLHNVRWPFDVALEVQ